MTTKPPDETKIYQPFNLNVHAALLVFVRQEYYISPVNIIFGKHSPIHNVENVQWELATNITTNRKLYNHIVQYDWLKCQHH